MGYLIGADIGSQSVKALLLDPDGRRGRLGRAGLHDEPSGQRLGRAGPGAVARRPGRDGRQLIAESGIGPGEVTHLGLASQVDGVVPVDHGLSPLRQAIIWLDRRAADQAAGAGRPSWAPTRSSPRTGLNTDSSHIAPKIMWLREHEPETYARRDLVPARGRLPARLADRDDRPGPRQRLVDAALRRRVRRLGRGHAGRGRHRPRPARPDQARRRGRGNADRAGRGRARAQPAVRGRRGHRRRARRLPRRGRDRARPGGRRDRHRRAGRGHRPRPGVRRPSGWWRPTRTRSPGCCWWRTRDSSPAAARSGGARTFSAPIRPRCSRRPAQAAAGIGRRAVPARPVGRDGAEMERPDARGVRRAVDEPRPRRAGQGRHRGLHVRAARRAGPDGRARPVRGGDQGGRRRCPQRAVAADQGRRHRPHGAAGAVRRADRGRSRDPGRPGRRDVRRRRPTPWPDRPPVAPRLPARSAAPARSTPSGTRSTGRSTTARKARWREPGR